MMTFGDELRELIMKRTGSSDPAAILKLIADEEKAGGEASKEPLSDAPTSDEIKKTVAPLITSLEIAECMITGPTHPKWGRIAAAEALANKMMGTSLTFAQSLEMRQSMSMERLTDAFANATPGYVAAAFVGYIMARNVGADNAAK